MNEKKFDLDDENLLLYYMNLCYKYEDILTEIRNVIERSDLEYGTSNYDYVMGLLNKCDLDNY